MHTMKQVLKPDWWKILLFVIFIAIAIGGKIQAWGFSDIPPKPPLYDLLRPFPIWITWMSLLAPLALLTSPLKLLGLDIMGGPPWLFIVTNIIYFYLLSCLVVAGYRWIKARFFRYPSPKIAI